MDSQTNVKTYKGSRPRISAEFKNNAFAWIDPTTLTLSVKDPNNEETIYTYGVGTTIVRDDVGQYHADIPLDVNGDWRFRYYAKDAAGISLAATETVIHVYSRYEGIN
jgi:hypothetical protein